MSSLPRETTSKAAMKLAAVAAVAAIVSACSPGPMPVSQSPRDPSNPDAAEGASAPAGPPIVASSAAAGAAAEPGHGVVYECPMHPEITSNEPGACPKCVMKLVPKK